MINNYIDYKNNVKNTTVDNQSNSYITQVSDSSTELNYNISSEKYHVKVISSLNTECCYDILPEEYSIFSRIDDSLFEMHDTDTEQHRFLALFLRYLRKKLFNIYLHSGILCILPKLYIAKDADDAIVINWAYTNYRIYFNFEKTISNSYYGIIAQNTEETFFTKTGKLNETNYELIINEVLDYVINNS